MPKNSTCAIFPLSNANPSLSTPSGATTSVVGDTIDVRASDGTLVARYDAETGELTLSAKTGVTISARQGTLTLEGEELNFAATRARFEVEQWEVRASRIVERTIDVFRTVEGLAETHARRMRMLVERTLELSGHRTSIVSKEDTRIDGKRVLLG